MNITRSLIQIASGLIISLIVLSYQAQSQIAEGGIAPSYPVASAASYYYISKPGELTMQVNVWGSVRNPGRYEVPTSTDLVQLISYAGGPNPDAKFDKVQVTRAAKKDDTMARQQITVNLEELDRVNEANLALRPGDTIFIDHTGWSTVRDVLTVVTTAAIVTSAIANVIIAEQRLR